MDFTPVVYEHAAALIECSPWDVSRDTELLCSAHLEAYRQYHHTPVVVGIDIYNLEPEAYGAEIGKPEGHGIPAVVKPICPSVHDLAQIPLFDPSTGGRIPLVIQAAKRLATELPEADVRVPVSGPISIAGNLMGFETLLCDALADSEATIGALMHLVEGQLRFCKKVRAHGLGVSLFESGASPPLISPRLFRDLVLPALKRLVDGAADIFGKPIPVIMGGDTLPILDYILETGTDYVICPVETDQPAFMAKIKDRTETGVRVNMSPRIVANGSRDETTAEVKRVLEIAQIRENTCIGTGPLPYETPPANVEFIAGIIGSL